MSLLNELWSAARPTAPGKFLYAGDQKLWVRGVTYGTFRPGADGALFPPPAIVRRDFGQIAAAGFNAVRTYTAPAPWLLDAAADAGLRVMVGLWWPQHVTFLDDRRRAHSIERAVRSAARQYADHPALLALAIGNEIPAPIVRWHGAPAIERHVRRLFEAAKEVDPGALVTYVNYPTTEYLELPFLDVVCFNVYLEARERLAAYLARLHNVAGDRPLLMGEIGLDSLRHGEDGQARGLEAQLGSVFAGGVAGAFAFAWTDEWHCGGVDIEDWAFGLTRRDRTPKPALGTVRDVMAELPCPKDREWPMISAIVCSYNGARTIRDTLEWLGRLEYPSYEVIVVNDGSTDATPDIARRFGVRVIDTPNRGLSRARNAGLAAAVGEIVAYIDDDAYPDPHWFTYLAMAFMTTDHAGIGGPNIPPAGDGPLAACVANAPGGPIHVLLSDNVAEHIPGCNMAFRKDRLQAIGGFDPQFRRAGDDVDVCWRLQAKGWTLGFSAPAMVWHHRRNSIRAYLRQQIGYGDAEAMLERKWPEKYNAAGHVSWSGRLYGKGLTRALVYRARIYHGTWGSAPFQSVYRDSQPGMASLTLMPEWYLLVVALAGLSLLGLLWRPLLAAAPLCALTAGASIAQAVLSGIRASFSERRPRWQTLGLHALTSLLHLLQPLARLRGRLRSALTPWRRHGPGGFAFPWARAWSVWTECWQASDARLERLETVLGRDGCLVTRGGDYDDWDLEVRAGGLSAVRIVLAIEEHGQGRQMVRFRAQPHYRTAVGIGMGVLSVGALLAGLDGVITAATVLGMAGLVLAVAAIRECGAAMTTAREALDVETR
jgi:glycosyltransferase involved in cell wall biosynthesis